jgi:GNAT superfamily N-acetyltransferase
MFAYDLMKSKRMKLPRNWRCYLSIVEQRYANKEIEYVLKLKLPGKAQYIDIGYINVQKKGKYNFVKVASVISNYRGKGCGSMLYEHAIKELGSLSTNYHAASSLAQRVWKRLIKKYRHCDEFFSGVLTVFKK